MIAQRLSVFLMDIRGIAYAFARFHTPHSRTHEGERRAFSRAVPTVTHMREISASRGGRATPRSQHRHCSSVRCSMLDARCSVLGARCSVRNARCTVLRRFSPSPAPDTLSPLAARAHHHLVGPGKLHEFASLRVVRLLVVRINRLNGFSIVAVYLAKKLSTRTISYL